MQSPLAEDVRAVLDYGLDLLSRLESQQKVDLEFEQAVLLDLLQRDSIAAGSNTHREDQAVSVQYALACWLDEIFTDCRQSTAAWNERKIEMHLFGANDRAWRFWHEAELALRRGEHDQLEVYYLCVALGFRGEMRTQHEKLTSWISRARVAVGDVDETYVSLEAELPPACEARPLRGERRMHAMVATACVVGLISAPFLTFIVVDWFGR
ncbi:MAG: DotU family type IV/VI secretion system protein [Blastopirellula sp. JB062]